MTKRSKRLLKIFALSMAILLALFFTLKEIARRDAAINCPGGRVDLKGRGEIIDYSEENGVVRIRMQKPGSQDTEVVLVDACTGAIKSSLKIDGSILKFSE